MEENFNCNYVPVKELNTYLFQWKIPHLLRPIIIKEMINMNLLKKENRFNIKIIKSNFDIKDIDKIYRRFHIY